MKILICLISFALLIACADNSAPKTKQFYLSEYYTEQLARLTSQDKGEVCVTVDRIYELDTIQSISRAIKLNHPEYKNLTIIYFLGKYDTTKEFLRVSYNPGFSIGKVTDLEENSKREIAKNQEVEEIKVQIIDAETYNIEFYKSSVSDIINGANKITNFAAEAERHKFSSNDSVLILAEKLSEISVELDKKYMPQLRTAYGAICKKMLWEENIDVKHNGTVITFIGGTFANNKRVKETHETLVETLRLLGFKKAKYLWYKGDDEYTFYNI